MIKEKPKQNKNQKQNEEKKKKNTNRYCLRVKRIPIVDVRLEWTATDGLITSAILYQRMDTKQITKVIQTKRKIINEIEEKEPIP